MRIMTSESGKIVGLIFDRYDDITQMRAELDNLGRGVVDGSINIPCAFVAADEAVPQGEREEFTQRMVGQ